MQFLPPLSSLAVLLLLLLVIAVICDNNSRFRKLLKDMPGPNGLPILGSAIKLSTLDHEGLFNQANEWCVKYGSAFKFNALHKHYVFTSQPNHLEKLLGNTKYINKSEHYRFMEPMLGEGLITSAGKKWHSRRKLLNPAFKSRLFDSFVEVFHEQSEILVNKLVQLCEEDRIEISHLLELCTLDIIVEVALGEKVQSQTNSNSEYLKAFQKLCNIFFYRMYNHILHVDWIFAISTLGKSQRKNIAIMHGFRNKVIERKRQERLEKAAERDNISHEVSSDDFKDLPKKVTYLDLLLECEETSDLLSDEGVAEEVDTIISAGHETTSGAVAYALFLLGTYKDKEQKVIEELDTIFGNSDRPPTMNDLREMKYLECCIKETLRIFPIVPIIARLLPEDLDLKDYVVPAGTTVIAFPYRTHRNPEIYPDPEEFIPERFFPENCKNRHPYAYIPFGAGPRICIGHKFALSEVKTILSTLLRRLRFEAVDKREDLKLGIKITLKSREGIRLKVTPRN